MRYGSHRVARRAAAAASALGLLAGVTACGSSDNGGSTSATASSGGSTTTAKAKVDCPVNYLLITTITGPGALGAKGTIAATNIAVDEVNKAGGVLGCPIHVDTKDVGADPTKDVPTLIKAISQKHYANINDESYGGNTILPTIAKEGLLSIGENGADGAGDPKKNPTFFDLAPNMKLPAAASVKVAGTKGYKKIAIITTDNQPGQAAAAGAEASAKAAGMQVVSNTSVPADVVNTSSAINRARSSNPDVLFLDAYGTASGYLLKDLKASGWKVPVYSGLLTGATDLPSLVPAADYQGLTVSLFKAATYPATPGAQKLIDAIKATGNVQTNLSLYVSAYDPVKVFAWAANKAGTLDPKKVAQTIEQNGSTPIPGVISGTTYSAASHYWNGDLAMAEPGKLVDGQIKRTADVPK